MTQLDVAAATANAHWCRAMCRAHRIDSRTTATVWSSPRRTPPYYPDAITLTATTDADTALTGIDDSAGCSVKDSFAVLDLSGRGYTVLLEAQWIHRPAPDPVDPPDDEEWTAVTTAEELERWQREWSDDPCPAGVFVPALLADPDVTIVAGRRGERFIGGGVLCRTGPGIDISNVFDRRGDLTATWRAVTAVASDRHRGSDLFGYEAGERLAAARRAGFVPVGPLRVWWRRT